ncbi:alginate O-acetyltransferase [uncultured Abyssibacter sp.]|uniref:alginate O-acetyltransferase n=1 Tax=uncultured Abyssibacter sp. TaxID=2320202 RepID=UPI0032B2D873
MRTPNAWIAVLFVVPFTLLVGAWSVVSAASFHMPKQVGWADGDAAARFEHHFDDAFPLRQVGQNLWAAARYELLGEGRDGLVVGRDGWFYTEQEFRPYPDEDANLRQHLQWIVAVHRYLADRGVDLAVTLLPAKARVYDEYRGEHAPSPTHAELYERARWQLRSAGVLVPDMLGAMQRCKTEAQVFLKTDTHWTPDGAGCVATALARDRRAQLAVADADPTEFESFRKETVEHRGDLMNYLPLAPVFESLLPDAERVPRIETVAKASGSADALFGGSDTVPVALVGTSYSADPLWHFTGALQQALRRDVVNFAEDGHGPFKPMARFLAGDALHTVQPRLVVWEIPERYLVQPDDSTEMPPLRTTQAQRHTEIRV